MINFKWNIPDYLSSFLFERNIELKYWWFCNQILHEYSNLLLICIASASDSSDYQTIKLLSDYHYLLDYQTIRLLNFWLSYLMILFNGIIQCNFIQRAIFHTLLLTIVFNAFYNDSFFSIPFGTKKFFTGIFQNQKTKFYRNFH